MYKVYGSAKTRTFRVLWLLEEIGAPYEFVATPPQSDAARRLKPLGKVPLLEVDGEILSDSVAIMTFLADRHGAMTFEAGSLQRAHQDGFTQRINDELDAPLWLATRHTMILPEKYRVPDIAPRMEWEFSRNLARLDADFDGPYLMGDVFTIADILLCQCLAWAKFLQYTLDSQKMADYFDAQKNRGAYKAALKNA